MDDFSAHHIDLFPEAPRFNYAYPLAIELSTKSEDVFPWFEENWTVCMWISLVYVFAIFAGQRYMQSKPAYELRGSLILWNLILAVFSLSGAVRITSELVHMWYHRGYVATFCDRSHFFEAPTLFWCYLFTLSKVYELGDTAFLVLRKRPVSFLHWYHHITVLLYVWYSFTSRAPGHWFGAMNYTVHGLMYTYYTLKALHVYTPRWVAMTLTTLQISQMIVGVFMNIQAYMIHTNGGTCHQSMANIQWSTLMYATYLLLFLRFFYNAYIVPKRRRSQKKDISPAPNITPLSENVASGVDSNRVAQDHKLKSH